MCYLVAHFPYLVIHPYLEVLLKVEQMGFWVLQYVLDWVHQIQGVLGWVLPLKHDQKVQDWDLLSSDALVLPC